MPAGNPHVTYPILLLPRMQQKGRQMIQVSSGGRRLIAGVATLSGTGRLDGHNEDSFAIVGDDELLLVAVADGMGGHFDGAVASRIAMSVLRCEVRRLAKQSQSPRTAEQMCRWVNQDLNPAIRQYMADEAQMDPRVSKMGTTLVFMLIWGETYWTFNLGDSRLYAMYEGEFGRLGDDHTLIEDPDYGMDPDTVRQQRKTHVVTRWVSATDKHRPDLYWGDLKDLGRVLLCSDGVHGSLDDEELENLLYSSNDPDEVANCIVMAAKDAGSSDDATAVVVIPLS